MFCLSLKHEKDENGVAHTHTHAHSLVMSGSPTFMVRAWVPFAAVSGALGCSGGNFGAGWSVWLFDFFGRSKFPSFRGRDELLGGLVATGFSGSLWPFGVGC